MERSKLVWCIYLLSLFNVCLVIYTIGLTKPNSKQKSPQIKSPLTQPNISTCTHHYKESHYAIIDGVNGRTGNMLFQIFCLLTLAANNCYTAVLSIGKEAEKHFDEIFDLRNVRRASIYDVYSKLIVSGLAHRNFDPEVLNTHDSTYNWTVIGLFKSWKYFIGQEKLIRSSVTFKKAISDTVNQYVKTHFAGRQTACIHVRRTDKIKNVREFSKYRNLSWYKPYIIRAMQYMKERYTDLAFIFISDDINWCKAEFAGQGRDVFFSPYKKAGYDLALMSFSNHTILTIGTFGWMGAWFSGQGTVIYQANKLPRHYYAGNDFFLPNWIGME